MLEEGARVEWFEDGRIKICFLLVLVSLPSFIFIELYSKNPILNLRLLGKPEFGITAIMTMMAAMALYGGVYALSLYLGQVQGYSASQIGKVMMWSGIPQLLIMPLVPWLMQKWDSRWLIAIGFSLFALSNQMNSALNSFYSGDQFTFSLIVRALGQPLFIIPLSSMGMGMVAPSDAASASAIYNVLRNLGGSIGIAITSTFAISREALHYNRHFETLTATDLNLNQAITGVQHYFVIWGGMELGRAKAAAIQILSKLVHREALIETFSDVFQILCFGLLGCLFCTILLKKQKLVTKGTGTVISE
jgi:DHA2 family multidrug resistance protein